jgi:hypothetical protein
MQSNSSTATVATPDPGQIQDFFKLVRPNGLQVVTAIDPNTGKLVTKTFEFPAQHREAAAWCEDFNRRGNNLYWTVNAVGKGLASKPTKEDITELVYLHADVDPDTKEFGSYKAAREHLLAGLQDLTSKPVPASLVIDSGNGMQVFLRLSHPIPVTEAILDRLENLNRRLAHACGAPPGTHNVDRIMRIPGTINYPTKVKIAKGYPRTPTLSRIIHVADVSYSREQLEEALPPLPAAVPQGDASVPMVDLSEEETDRLVGEVEELAKNDFYLDLRWKGSDVGLKDTSRSGMDMSLGAMLKVRGFTPSQMREILIRWDHGAGPEKVGDPTDGPFRYFQRIWANAHAGPTVAAAAVCADLRAQTARKNAPLEPHEWAPVVYSARLTSAGLDAVLDELVKLKAGKRRSLVKDYQEYAAQRHEIEQQQALARDANQAKRSLVLFDECERERLLKDCEREMVERSAHGALFRFGGRYAYIETREPEGAIHGEGDLFIPAVPQISLHSQTSLLIRLERSVRLTDGQEQLPIPERLARWMLESPVATAPRVNDVCTHPIFTPDGRYLSQEGIDPSIRIAMQFGGARFLPPASGMSAEAMWASLSDLLFSEFEFEGDGKAHALAILLTGLQRKVLEAAPMGLITGARQGSGKTTLARGVHNIVAGHRMPVRPFPTNMEEARKQMLTALIQNPALVVFDNLPDGEQVRLAVLSEVLLNPTYTDRLLGASSEITVSTRSLFLLTGNNLALNADLVRRTLTVYLDPSAAHPERRRFKHPDYDAHCFAHRGEVVRLAMGIIWASLKAGDAPFSESSGISPNWDRLVRAPVLRATGVDPITAIDVSREHSAESEERAEALWLLHEAFGWEQFQASDVTERLFAVPGLESALRAVSGSTTRIDSSKGVAKALRKLLNNRYGDLALAKPTGWDGSEGRKHRTATWAIRDRSLPEIMWY